MLFMVFLSFVFPEVPYSFTCRIYFRPIFAQTDSLYVLCTSTIIELLSIYYLLSVEFRDFFDCHLHSSWNTHCSSYNVHFRKLLLSLTPFVFSLCFAVIQHYTLHNCFIDVELPPFMMLLLHKILLQYAIIRLVFVILLHIAWSSVLYRLKLMHKYICSLQVLTSCCHSRFLEYASMQSYLIPWIFFCIYSAHFRALIRRNPRLIYLPRIPYLPYNLLLPPDRSQNRKYSGIVLLSTFPYLKWRLKWNFNNHC
jgi:hypothetical protein